MNKKKLYLVIVISVVFFCILLSSYIYIAKHNTNPIRAQGVSKYGKLLISPKTSEKQYRLDEISSFGNKGDYVFEGDYDVIYESKSGQKKIIQSLSNLKVIQSSRTVNLQKIEFPEFDLFVFTPQYSASNDVESYFFALTNEDAFLFNFEFNKASGNNDSSVSSIIPIISQTKSEYKPKKQGDNLIIKTTLNIGDNDLTLFEITFNPDLKNRIMKFISKSKLE